jgi:prevent-host-death family protein
MTSLSLAEAKAKFSSVVEAAQAGESTIVTKGRSKTPVAVVVPIDEWEHKQTKRQLGSLAHLGPVLFAKDWKMTDEDLISS